MKATLAEVLAQAVIDSRVTVCTHVPGYGGTETFAEYRKLVGNDVPYSFHEEVAYSVAHGAGLVGHRAACLIKTHGFAKATNSILSSMSTGTLGGVVVFAFDDPEGSHSDNIFDAEGFIRGSGIPYERLSLRDAYEQTWRMFERSEKLGLPCALIVDTRQIQGIVAFEKKAVEWRSIPFESRPDHRVACPPLSAFQKQVLDRKLSGQSGWQELKPARLLKVPSGLPSPLRETAESYVPVFEEFKAVVRKSGTVVAADAGTSGLFAFAPYHCIDFLTFMGGSTSLALGAHLAGFKSWAVTGEFSFVAAGILGLLEAELRKVPLKLLIFDNHKASATGGQSVDERALRLALAPYMNRVERISSNVPRDKIRSAIARTHDDAGLRILVVDCRSG